MLHPYVVGGEAGPADNDEKEGDYSGDGEDDEKVGDEDEDDDLIMIILMTAAPIYRGWC